MESIPSPHIGGQDTHVILFWCSVSKVVLRSSVVALLSMFRKRSIAEILRWMLCFGMSSLETKVNKPRSSQLNSIGQQSWPCKQISRKHVKKHNQHHHLFVFLLLLIAELQRLILWKSLLIINFIMYGVFASLKHYNALQGEKNRHLQLPPRCSQRQMTHSGVGGTLFSAAKP